MDKKEVLIEVKDLKKYFQVGRNQTLKARFLFLPLQTGGMSPASALGGVSFRLPSHCTPSPP